MEFAFTEEQRIFRDSFKAFVAKELAPIAQEYDHRGEFPRHIFRKLGELGELGLMFPAEYGGGNGDAIMTLIMFEEMSYASPAIAVGIYVHAALAMIAIDSFGTPEQKQKYLVPGIKGEKIGAWGFAEPNAGSDPGSMTTRAKKTADGHYIINGTKMFISNGSFADFVVLTAFTDPTKGMKGLSLFIVDKGSPGFSVAQKLRTMGMKANDTTELVFEDCQVPAFALLGEENEFNNIMRTLTFGRIVASAICVGLARGAFDHTLRYAKERIAFGQPIGKFQGIQWMLADAATQIDAARLLTYQAGWLYQQGLPHIREACMAKLFASETATKVANTAVQIHGGYGLMMDYPIQMYYRDCKLLEIGEGTSQIQRNTIARQLGL
ncbi:MAG: acyl-CoA dehydrogenase [Chloroflexi bacterium]|nr:acyl-CoA dehydrogenase [Chloroflexota bacterium]MBM3182519.1 acyl-CoA dehydrogenase [Chloroflexota bacterium]MBM4451076.1 acyl-CoA dehydrogenase [Chloroflexota bacterium]